MRLPMLWFTFCLLFAFWLAAFFFHLSGGLTTYSLLVIAIALFAKTARAAPAPDDEEKTGPAQAEAGLGKCKAS